MRSLCLVRCSFNTGWNSPRFPSFKNAPCTVEFYVNRALRLLQELLQEPRKARFYLRTGRLSMEKPLDQQMEEIEVLPQSSTSFMPAVDKLDPLVVLKTQALDLAAKPGLELGTSGLGKSGFELPLTGKLGFEPIAKLNTSALEPPNKFSTEVAARLVDQLAQQIATSRPSEAS